MRKNQIRSIGDALAYITDCNLATVSYMASYKSHRKRYEFKRQVAIAQTAIDLMEAFNVNYSGTRAAEVVAIGNVEEWAKQFMA